MTAEFCRGVEAVELSQSFAGFVEAVELSAACSWRLLRRLRNSNVKSRDVLKISSLKSRDVFEELELEES